MEGKSHRRPKVPPRMIPNKLRSFEKYNQSRYPRKVPNEYKKAVKALQLFDQQKIPIEQTINPKKPFDKEAYFLAVKTLERLGQINYMLTKLKILEDNETLDPWLARVLVTEMIYCSHQNASSSANDVEAMKYYEESMRDMFVETTAVVPNNSDVHLPVYVRINVLKISIEDCIRAFFKEGWNLINLPHSGTYEDYLTALRHLPDNNFMKDFHISELLIFPPGTVFYNHPGYLEGKLLLQDKGSCLSSFLLNPKPGSVVLDICAAPGLKTNHLANIMNNEGLIIANDEHPFRCDSLCKLLDLTKVKCAQTSQHDYLDIYTKIAHPEEIEYILVDPTCSYSGLFCNGNRKKERLRRLGFKFSMTLRYCLQTFPNLKRLVFTTCSIYPEEGESAITEVLKEIGNSYDLLNVKEMLWNQWIDLDEESDYYQYECSQVCLRTLPERDLTPGYFIAVFQRNFEVPVPPYRKLYQRGSKTYTADEFATVDKVNKRNGKIVHTHVLKEKLKAKQNKHTVPQT